MVKHSSLSRSWLFEAVFERVLLCVSGVNITMVSSRDKAPDFSLGADHPIKVGQSKKGTDPMRVFLDATVSDFPVPHLQFNSSKNMFNLASHA